jgi:hypothetical protein
MFYENLAIYETGAGVQNCLIHVDDKVNLSGSNNAEVLLRDTKSMC